MVRGDVRALETLGSRSEVAFHFFMQKQGLAPFSALPEGTPLRPSVNSVSPFSKERQALAEIR